MWLPTESCPEPCEISRVRGATKTAITRLMRATRGWTGAESLAGSSLVRTSIIWLQTRFVSVIGPWRAGIRALFSSIPAQGFPELDGS